MLYRQEKASYSGFTLVLDSQQVEEGKRWFDNLAANGKIEMARQETFWAHGFGKVTDKFGVPWMINAIKQQPTHNRREARPPALSLSNSR